jgi:Tol biopolymer transport system component
MKQKNHPRQETGNPETMLSRYSIEYLKSTTAWPKLYNILVFIIVGLISFASCKKNDVKIDEEFGYGTIEPLKVDGQSPLWSPLGGRIAYLTDGGLYVINSDGSGNLLLTAEASSRMKWSPSGTELAYQAYRGGPLAIYKIGVDGNNDVKLTGSGFSVMEMDFSWSPDGEKIVYGVPGVPGKVDMYIMNKDGSDNQKIDIPLFVIDPKFTPGGNQILFSSFIEGNSKRALFLVGADGSNLQMLQTPDIVDILEFVMNRDGSKIYFSGRTSSNILDIYEINTDGSGLRNLTNGIGSNRKPVMSPDGRYIAFVSYRNDIDGLWIMHADGSNASRISKGTYHFFTGSWSPDSRKLVFDDEVDGVRGIYVLTLK